MLSGQNGRILTNNYTQAMQRAESLAPNLKRDKMKHDFKEFMKKLFTDNHAEEAPLLQKGQEANI